MKRIKVKNKTKVGKKIEHRFVAQSAMRYRLRSFLFFSFLKNSDFQLTFFVIYFTVYLKLTFD